MNRKVRDWRIFVLLSLSAPPAMAATPSSDIYLSYSGTATAPHSGEILYSEHDVLHYRDGRLADRVVLYACRDGQPFARKAAVYGDHPLAPDFSMDDVSTGMREGVRTRAGQREVFFRRVHVEGEKSAPLPSVPQLVVDTGFDEFIRANWQRLVDGEEMEMRFLVPSRLDEMSFQVQRLRAEQLDGIPMEVFRLKLAGALGWVLPGIEVSYSAEGHILMRYTGLSDLRDAAGNNLPASITFHSIDRRLGTEQESETARQAVLAACPK
jgi:hypothetical protein